MMRFFPNLQTIYRTILFVGAVILSQSASAQVDVAGSMGADGTYPTLTAAFTGLNTSGPHNGATIVVTITASTNEGTGTAQLNAGTWTTLSIKPAVGVAATVTGTTTAGRPILQLAGADNVTLDGLNTGGSSLTITNPTASSAVGTSTILFNEGATNNLVTNCTILGCGTNSATGSGTIYFGGDGTTPNGNDNNVISNNLIGPSGTILPSKAIVSIGVNSTVASRNSGNVISGNMIFDYFLSSGTSAGVYLGAGTTDWTIQNNRFYQTSSRSLNNGVHSAITMADANINNYMVSGNTIGFSSASGTGTYTLVAVATTAKFYPLYISASGIAAGNTIQNNTITAISFSGLLSGTSTANPFSALYFSSGLASISNNIIGSTTVAGAITISSTTSFPYEAYGLLAVQESPVTGNSIGGILVNNTGAAATTLYALRSAATTTSIIQNNTVGFSAAPIGCYPNTISARLIGIYSTGLNATITGNTVAFLQTRSASTSTGGSAGLIGIYSVNSSPSLPSTISQNHIHSLSNTNASTSINIVALYFSSANTSGSNVISQNLIHSLSAVTTGPSASLTGMYTNGSSTFNNNMISLGLDETGASLSNDLIIDGIYETAGTNQFYFNSVYIGGSSVTGANSTFAFLSQSSSGSRDIRNNIFYNARSNGSGTGKHYAISVAGTAANPPGLTSDYNDLYVDGTGGALGYFNGTPWSTLSFWQPITGQDMNSQNSNPHFINPAGSNTTVNLHISLPSAAIDGTGTAIAGITDDYDGQIRAGLTPTDIGADAGNFLPLPILGTYPNTTVMAGKNATVTPSAAPVNTSQTVAYSTSDLHGVLAVNPTTGVVTITDVMHAGTYLVTVQATGAYGSSTATFTLTITSPNCSQGIVTGTTNMTLPGGGPQGIVVADFNNDGNQDIATANNSASTVSVRLGNGAGGFTGTTDLTGVGSNPRYLAAGDFDGDGNQDIVNSAVSSASLYISLGDGLGGFYPALSVAVAAFPTGVSVGDFNNDGKPDLAAGTSGNTVSIRLGNGFGGFTVMPDVVTVSPNWTVGIGDFNEDGKQDLAIVSNNAVNIRLGDGAGNFAGTTSIATGAGTENIVIADFNHDNHLDFATSNNSAGTVSIRLGDGTGGFTGTTDLAIGSSTSCVATGDFNGDGNIDLAISRIGSVILIRYGDGLGNFSGSFSIAAGGNFTRRLAVGDFNNDGYNDLAVPSETVGNVAIRLGGANEMNVTGNAVTIADGDVTPSSADFTNFGVACSGSAARTFTIQNTGTQNLSVTGVTITGANASDFVVTTAPASTIAPAGSTSFVVTFTAGGTGLRNATITIANNDCDEASYDFAISGTGTTAVTGTTVVTNVSCFGGSNAAINLTPAGGGGGYTFNWLPSGPTTEDRTSLTAGTYSVQITDVNGCSSTVTATVTQPTSPVSGTTVVTNVACFGGSTGAINLTPTGGSGGFTFNWLPSGPTTEDRTGLTAGTYSVQIADVNGCTGTVTATVTQPTSPVSGTTVVTNVACFGGSNGAINLTPTGGSGGYTFNWLPSGPTTEDRTGLAAGTYSVQIADMNGCTATVTATLTQPTSPVSGTTVVINVSCFGGSNGAINLTPGGGSGGYTFNWLPSGPTTEDRTGLTAGTYSVQIMDANGCTGTVTANVTQPPAISVTASAQTNVSCFGGSNGAASINAATGGSGGFTYNWTPGNPTGDGTTSVTGLTAGTWVVTTTDANGCTATNSFTVTQPPAISVTASSQTNVSCFGGSNGAASINAATGGSGGFTYNWTPGNPTGDGTTSVTGLTAGTWVVTTTDVNGCSVSNTFNVTEPPQISFTASAQTNVSCFGGSNGAFQVNAANGGTGAFTYDWSPGNPTGDGTTSVSGLTAGPWSVTATDANGCSATINFTITEPPQISFTASSQTNVSCFGGNNGAFSVNAATGGTGSFTYDWSPGNPSGDGTTSASGLTAGPWSVTATDQNGCSATINFTITEPPQISFTASSQTNVSCFGGSNGAFQVNAANGGTGAFTYDWSPGNPTGDGTTSVSGLTAGPWSVTATDANGCSATINFTITEPPQISFTASSQTNVSCFGGNNGAFSVNAATGGTGSFTYDWSPGSPTGDGTTSVSGLTVGPWSVMATDANGCSATINFTITEPPAIVVTATSQTDVSCFAGNNGSASVTASGGTGALAYAWSSGGTAATETGLSAGNYSVTITDANSCSATATFTIAEPTAITFTSSQTDVSCNGGMNGDATVNATGGTGALTYAWSSGGTAATETGLLAGNYSVAITDANSCSTTATFTIAEPTAITFTSSQTDVSCFGGTNGTATVNATGGTGALAYAWSSGGTAATETGLSAGNYSVNISDSNLCMSTATITITEPPVLSVTISSTMNTTTCGGSDGSIDINVTGGTPTYTFLWSNSDLNEDLTAIAAGSYSVIVTDANGCTGTVAATVSDPAPPLVTLALPIDTACGSFPGLINLSGESPAGGTWSGNTVSGNTFDPFAAGTGMHVITYTFTDVTGCTGSATDSLYVDPCTGIKILTATEWDLFPNPTNGELTIVTTAELNSDVLIEIYSADGKLLGSENKQQAKTITLNMSLEPVGVYFIRITANDKVSMHRVIKI